MGKSRNSGKLPIHIAIWLVMFAMPFFSPQPGHPLHQGIDYSRFLPTMVSFFVVFYVNFIFLIKKFLYPKKIGFFVLWNVVLIAAVSLLVHLSHNIFFPMPDDLPPRHRSLLDTISFITRNTMIYVAIIGIAVAVKSVGDRYDSEAERQKIERSKTEAELENLKSQINPHFLFNTLNNIYSLIQIDQDKAQEAVENLSGMLRYVLYDSDAFTVPLSKEISFLEDYIRLMKMRLSSNVSVDVSMPAAGSDKEVVPLLFIPLVENAFKHGVSDTEPSFIRISVREAGDTVTCQIENSNFPKTDSDRSGSGIGIKNLTRRREMFYPGAYSFESGLVQSTYQTILRISTSGLTSIAPETE